MSTSIFLVGTFIDQWDEPFFNLFVMKEPD